MMAKSNGPEREGRLVKIFGWGTAKEAVKEPAKSTSRKKATPPSKGAGEFILTPFGVFLSTCSVVWTTFSAIDLLGIGAIGLTVAISLDVIWVGLTVAAHQEIPMWGSVKTTQGLGWAFLLAVVVVLAWHGVSLNGKEIFGYYVDEETSKAIAITGPILPIGGKVMWLLVSAARKKRQHELANPEGYTDEQIEKLDDLERISKFQEAESQKQLEAERRKHLQELEKIRMQGEQVLEQEKVDHRVDVARYEHTREMRRLSPTSWTDKVIPGEIERIAKPTPAALPAKTTARKEITVDIADVTEAQRKNMMLAAEYILLVEKDPAYSQNSFASDKGISAGHLSRVLKAYKAARENGTLAEILGETP